MIYSVGVFIFHQITGNLNLKIEINSEEVKHEKGGYQVNLYKQNMRK